MAEPAGHERVKKFWERFHDFLQWYREHSVARLLGLEYREGWYVSLASGLLIAAVVLGAFFRSDEASGFLPVLVLLAAIYIVDAILVSAAILFVTHNPIDQLRSLLLTLFTVANVAVAFAVFYVALPGCIANRLLRPLEAVYFSFVTIATLGYGDLHPAGRCAWRGQLVVMTELAAGVFFLAVVVGAVVAWTPRPLSEHRYNKLPPTD